MTKRMTAEQLEAIRKRAEAASEGPWEFDGVGYCGEYPYIIDLTVGEVGVRYHAEDAEFISKARTDIPALLAEVERLQKIFDRLSEPLTIEAVAADGRRIKMEGVKLNLVGGESDD